jgi:L,D-transpeptidase ErfK/SrfK
MAKAKALVIVVLLIGAATVTAQSPGQVVGEAREIVVARGDTLGTLGSRYGVDPSTIARDNGIAVASRLAVGQRLRIEARHVVPAAVAPGTIVVNVPQRMLFLGSATATRAWPVAVGRRSWPTPIGPFTVVTREEHPTWDVPASIIEEARRAGRTLPAVVPPGPDNPLGDYWLGLSVGSIGIHGTNAPASIYQAVTHGCIRVHPDDIAVLFAAVPTGTRGMVIYEPVLVGADRDGIVLEVHPDVYRRGPADVLAFVRAQLAALVAPVSIDWSRVSAAIAEQGGVPRTISFPDGRPDWRERSRPTRP